MKNELIECMSQFTEFSDEEAQLMIESNPLRTYKKGNELLKEGQVSKDAFLVLKGQL